jgi:predicted peptidase
MVEAPRGSKTPYSVTLGGKNSVLEVTQKVNFFVILPNFFEIFQQTAPETTTTCLKSTQLLIEIMMGGTLHPCPG